MEQPLPEDEHVPTVRQIVLTVLLTGEEEAKGSQRQFFAQQLGRHSRAQRPIRKTSVLHGQCRRAEIGESRCDRTPLEVDLIVMGLSQHCMSWHYNQDQCPLLRRA